MRKKAQESSSSSSSNIYNISSSDLAAYADFFENNSLEELVIEEKGTRVVFRKEGARAVPAAGQIPIAVSPPAAVAAPPLAKPEESQELLAPVVSDNDGSQYAKVVSPLNGTFYSSSSPESAPYVTTGDMVSPGKTLCIVEAMKIFNEIKAETSGKIVRILVKNAEAVQEGQELFWIEPS